MILQLLVDSPEKHLVFKGGTALNKIHAGFYRLSEDLDFSISTPPNASRTVRSNSASPFKDFVTHVPKLIPTLKVKRPLTGSNGSVQYNSEFEYESVVLSSLGTIQFEIGLREEIVHKPARGLAKTLAQNPFTLEPLHPVFEVVCLSKEETYSEKVRAALSRRTPAIRDLFDLDYAIRTATIYPDSKELVALTKVKLAVPDNDPIDLSESRKKQMRSQLEESLRPVLRPTDYEAFDFDLAWKRLLGISDAVQK